MAPDSHAKRTERALQQAYYPLLIVAIAACAGIALDRMIVAPIWMSWGAGVALNAVWFLLWRQRRLKLASVALCAAVAAAGATWGHTRWNIFPKDEIGFLTSEDSRPACLEAIVTSGARFLPAPDADPLRPLPPQDRSRFIATVVRVRDGETWRPASGRVQMNAPGRLTDLRVGETVRAFGQLSNWEAPLNPEEFDFHENARADRRIAQFWSGSQEAIQRTPGGRWRPGRWIDRTRARGLELISKYVPSQSRLAGAVLLGNREELDRRGTDAFFTTGMVHVLSISGLHVSILAIAGLIALQTGILKPRWAHLLVALIVLFYALVIEAETPAIRAVAVVVCGSLASRLARPGTTFNVLGATMLVAAAIAPADLFRVGPQFSFIAVAVLAWLSEMRSRRPELEPIDRLIARSRPWHSRMARTFLERTVVLCGASLAIWIVLSPMIVQQFHLISPAALFLTPLLSIPITAAMVSGFLVLVFGAILPFVASIFGALCDFCLGLVEWGTLAAAENWPSHLWSPGPADWWVGGFYLALAAMAAVPPLRPSRKWLVAMLAGWTTAGLAASWLAAPRNELRATFVAVGHGCSVLLETPNGRNILYDAGQFGSPERGARQVAGVLWSRGVTHLDAVIVSHADIDHFNALPDLLDRFSVGVVYVSPMMRFDPPSAVQELFKAIEKAGVPLRELSAGDRFRFGDDCSMETLHPPRLGVVGSDNANSIVLLLESGKRKLLLTGDLESPGLEALLEEEPIDCDVTLAPHHGSEFSNPPGFSSWCTPEYVIVSRGRQQNADGEAGYLSGGAQVFSTAEAGAITVVLGRESVKLSTFLAKTAAPAGVASRKSHD